MYQFTETRKHKIRSRNLSRDGESKKKGPDQDDKLQILLSKVEDEKLKVHHEDPPRKLTPYQRREEKVYESPYKVMSPGMKMIKKEKQSSRKTPHLNLPEREGEPDANLEEKIVRPEGQGLRNVLMNQIEKKWEVDDKPIVGERDLAPHEKNSLQKAALNLSKRTNLQADTSQLSEILHIANKESIQKLKYGSEFKDLLDARDQILEHKFDFEIALQYGNQSYEEMKKQMLTNIFSEIKDFLVESASNIVSVAFKFLKNKQFMDKEAKNYCASNLLLNLHSIFSEACTAIKSSKLVREKIREENRKEESELNNLYYLLALKAEDIYNSILGNLENLYPQAPPTGGTPRMRDSIREINKMEQEENDFLFANDIKIQNYINQNKERNQQKSSQDNKNPSNNQNYTRFIMDVINKAIQVTQSSEEDEKKRTTIEIFTQFNQQLFWLSQETDKLQKKKYIPEFFNQTLERAPAKKTEKNEEFEQSKIVELPTEKNEDEVKKEKQKKRKEQKKRNQQEEKEKELQNLNSRFEQGIEKMKDSPKFAMGSKIPSYVKEFTELELRYQQFSAKHSSILRIMTKWAEYLNQFFQEPERHVLQRQSRFKNTENKLVTLFQQKKLVKKLKKEGKEVKQKFLFLQKQFFEWMGKLMSQKEKQKKEGYVCRYSDTRVLASKVNFILTHLMLNYLNVLIHHLLKAGEQLKIENKQRADISLVVFRVSDLMRSKLQCSERSFINVLKIMENLDNDDRMKGKFKIVRIKNKLDEPSSNIIINYLFMNKIQCELQLSTQNLKDKEKDYYTFSHLIYELTRGKFGALAECVIMISQLDPLISASKGSYYQERSIKQHHQLKQLEQDWKNKQKGPEINEGGEKEEQEQDQDQDKEQEQDQDEEGNKVSLLQNSKKIKTEVVSSCLPQITIDSFKEEIQNSVFQCKSCKNPIINENSNLFKQEEEKKVCNSCNLEQEAPEEHLQKQQLKSKIKRAISQKLIERIVSYQKLSEIKNFECILKINTEDNFELYLCIKVKEEFNNFLVRIDDKIIQKFNEKILKYIQLDSINITQKIKKEKAGNKKMSQFLFIIKKFQNFIDEMNINFPLKKKNDLDKFVDEFRDFRLEKTLIKTIKAKSDIIDANNMKSKFQKLGKVIKYLEEKNQSAPTPEDHASGGKKQAQTAKNNQNVQLNNAGQKEGPIKQGNEGQDKNVTNNQAQEEDQVVLKYQKIDGVRLDEIRYIHAKNIGMQKLPKWLCKFSHLISLDLASNRLSKYELNSLPDQLTHLYLSKNKFKDKVDLSNLLNLNYLDLSRNKITFINVKELQELQSLILSHNKITSKFQLVSNPKLKSLEIDDNSIEQLFLNLPNLQTLNFQNNDLTQIITLKNLQKITELPLNYSNLSKLNLENLKKLSTLKGLKCQISQMNIKQLVNLREFIFPNNNLTEIYFNCEDSVEKAEIEGQKSDNSNAGKKGLIDNISCKLLTTINLQHNNLTKVSFGTTPLVRLTKLELSNNSITRLKVDNLPKIEQLFVNDNGLEGQFKLTTNSNLKKLEIKNNSIENLFLTLPNLEQLNFEENQKLKDITLKNMEKLNALSLDNLKVSSRLYLEKLNGLSILDGSNSDIKSMYIKQFSNLRQFIFPSNQFTNIFFNCDKETDEKNDDEKNPQRKGFIDQVSSSLLTTINLKYNDLTEISFGKENLKKLIKLDISNNKIKELDIQYLVNVRQMYASNNHFTEFKCADLRSLEILKINNNQMLTILELEDLPKLNNLGAASNKLKQISLVNLEGLAQVWLDNNQLSELKIKQLPNLQKLYLEHNELTEMDLNSEKCSSKVFIDKSSCKNLIHLDIQENKLSSITFGQTDLPKLSELILTHNHIKTINIQNLIAIKQLRISQNELQQFLCEDKAKLEVLKINYNKLKKISLKNLQNLQDLGVANNQLTSLELVHFPKLRKAWFDNNKITQIIKIEQLPVIDHLDISDNNITTLRLQQLPSLNSLDVGNNPLKTVQLSQLPQIRNIDNFSFQNNPNLETLIMVKMQKIQSINTTQSNLKKISLKELSHLSSLTLRQNLLIEAELNDCPLLRKMQCSKMKQLQTLTLEQLPMLQFFKFKNCSFKLKKLPPSIQLFECSESSVTMFDFKNLPNLKQLKVDQDKVDRNKFLNLKKQVVLLSNHQKFSKIQKQQQSKRNQMMFVPPFNPPRFMSMPMSPMPFKMKSQQQQEEPFMEFQDQVRLRKEEQSEEDDI